MMHFASSSNSIKNTILALQRICPIHKICSPQMNNPVLREARSSPYIGNQPEGNSSGAIPRLQSANSDERFGKALLKEAFSVHFNTGSSSSSTDFLPLCIESHQTITGNGLQQQWAKQQRHHQMDQQEQQQGRLQQRNERNAKAESADNLAESGQSEQSSMTGEISEMSEGANVLGKHRSETNLPGKARDHGFRMLEKCCSVELSPGKFMIPPSRLARSKEMPNIADVDDCEIATYDS